MLLILLKYLTPKRHNIYFVIFIYFSFWTTLLVLNLQLKTILVQLEPLLDEVEILEEIHCW